MNGQSNLKVLVVDDDDFLRESIVAYLEDSNFTVIQAHNGQEGLDIFRIKKPDVVLLDLRMPVMDGLEALPIFVKEAHETPVIIVSGMGTMSDSIKALRLGAWDYITKPVQDMALLEHSIKLAYERSNLIRENRQYRENLENEVKARTKDLSHERALLRSMIDSIPDLISYKDNDGIYLGCNKAFENYANTTEKLLIGKTDREIFPGIKGNINSEKDQLLLSKKEASINNEWLNYNNEKKILVETLKTPYFGPDNKVLGLIGISRDMSERVKAEKDRKKSSERIKTVLHQTIQAVSMAMEKRDQYTAGHQQKVATIAVAIANTMGLPEQQVEGIRLGSTIHDIGKIYVPAEILTRPGKITPEEFAIIKSHSKVGYEIIKDVDFPWPVAQMILQHHERQDGSGYPQGLSNNEMILEAKIISVADVVEAMASHRPYRASLGVDCALDEISKHRGSLYDADVVDACLKIFKEDEFTIN